MAIPKGLTAKEFAAWANSKFPEEFRLFCVKFPIEEKIFLPSTPFIQVAGLTIGLDLHCDVLLCVGMRIDLLDSRRWTGSLYAALRKDFAIDFITRDSEDGSFRRFKPSNFGTEYKLYPEYADVFSLDKNIEFARNLRNACMYAYLKGGHVAGFYPSTHIRMNLFEKMCKGLAGVYSMDVNEQNVSGLALAAAEINLVERSEADLKERKLQAALDKAKQNAADARRMRREERKQWKDKYIKEKRDRGEEVAFLRAKHAKEMKEIKELYDLEVTRRKQAEQALQQSQQGKSAYFQ